MSKKRKIYIKTFGCVQNTADSERVKAYFWNKGYEEVENWKDSDLVVINTCIIRESAENRVYGLIDKVNKWNKSKVHGVESSSSSKRKKIIVTGCLAGLANQDKTGKKLKKLKADFPAVSEFLPTEKISYDISPLRNIKNAALIPISSGCSNFCSYCIVPFARGPEVSRDFGEILNEVDDVLKKGFKKIVLIGQNVNSYGADFIKNKKRLNSLTKLFDFTQDDIIVSMGKKRFPSLFPKLLEEIAKKDVENVSFLSSNPWDYSDELIKVISKYPNIDRLLHLPIQSGDDEILNKMNRGYTAKDYLDLIKRIRSKVNGVKFSTDIIIGFPGEDDKAFQNTVNVCKEVNFEIGYLNKYSPRKGTVSAKIYENDVPQAIKKERWKILNNLINIK